MTHAIGHTKRDWAKRGLVALTAGAIGALMLATGAMAEPTIAKSVKVAPGGLYEIVFNPADSNVYVAAVGQRGENNAAVVRLNGATLEVAGPNIDVSANPLFGLGINTRTQVLYGTDTRGGDVMAVDIRTGQVLATIKDGEEAAHVREVVVDEINNKAYVSIVGGAAGDASNPNLVWVIDGATQTLERKITVPIGSLTGIAVDGAAKRLYVSGIGSHEVAAIDLTNDKVVGQWPSGAEGPINLVVDSAGQRLFVANQKPGVLTVLNSQTGALIKSVPTGEGALGIAYNPAVSQVYIANRTAGTVTVVDSNSYAVLANLTTGTFPQTIAIDRTTNAVYVSNKARGLPRNAPAGTPVPVDPTGDVLTLIRP